MQAAAKQFRGDFFVAIDQPVGKFVRIEAPFLNGDVGVRGDAIAMPAVRNGRKGLVIRLVKLDADSLGIPIQEQTKELSLDEDEDPANEFEMGQATVASNVSAAVAKSIRSTSTASDRAQPVKLQAPIPEPVAKSSQPTKLEDLDAETREAVDEFADVSTKASDITDEMAKKLTERSVPPATNVVRRSSEPNVHAKPTAKIEAVEPSEPSEPNEPIEPIEPVRGDTLSSLTDDDDGGLDQVTQIGVYEELIEETKPEPKVVKPVEPRVVKPVDASPPPQPQPQPQPPPQAPPLAARPAPASKAATATLVFLILLTIAAAAFFLIYEL